MQVRTGTYSGTGSAQTITYSAGLSGDILLLIGRDSTTVQPNNSCLASTTMAAGRSLAALGIGVTTAVTTINGSSFDVGTHGSCNASGVEYNYVAFGTGGGTILNKVDYQGDGNDDRSITGLGFQPDFVIIHSDGTSNREAIWRSSTQITGGDASGPRFSNTPTSTNLIQALEADGVQVGTSTQANANLVDYTLWGWKFTAGACDGDTYAGDGSDDRQITHPTHAFLPAAVLIFSDNPTTTTRGVVYKGTTMAGSGDYSVVIGDFGITSKAGAANLIQALNSTGFQVGSDIDVNRSAPAVNQYTYLSCATGSATDSTAQALPSGAVGGFSSPFTLNPAPYQFLKSGIETVDRLKNIKII